MRFRPIVGSVVLSVALSALGAAPGSGAFASFDRRGLAAGSDSSDVVTDTFTTHGNPDSQGGLAAWASECRGSNPEPLKAWTFLISRNHGRSSGQRYIGYQPTQAGWERGFSVPIAEPGSLTSLKIRLIADPGLTGDAVVVVSPTGTDDTWIGKAPISSGDPGTLIEAAQDPYLWSRYVGGVDTGETVVASVPDFVATYGGDGPVARVGFQLGCSGGSFFVDDFAYAAGSETAQYDFEGLSSRVSLDIASKKVRYGSRVKVAGTVNALGGVIGPARLTLRGADGSGAKLHSISTQPVAARTHRATFLIRPQHSGRYAVVFGGNDQATGSQSVVKRVIVEFAVKAKVGSHKVVRGSTYKVFGRVLPHHRVRVELERYVGHSWIRVAKQVTDNKGGFGWGLRSGNAGKFKYRVVAAGTSLNAKGESKPVTVIVTAPPHHGHGGSGGGSTPGGPPPPPPDNDPGDPGPGPAE
jgi:hypothetical protein